MSSQQTPPAGGTVSKGMVQELSGELAGSTALWTYPVYTWLKRSKALFLCFRSITRHRIISRSVSYTETERNRWRKIKMMAQWFEHWTIDQEVKGPNHLNVG